MNQDLSRFYAPNSDFYSEIQELTQILLRISEEKIGGWSLCSGLLVAMAGIHQLWLYCLTDMVWWKNLKFTSGTMVSVAGSGNEENRNNSYPAKAAFAQPSGVAATSDFIYVADSESSTIRKITRCLTCVTNYPYFDVGKSGRMAQ